MKHTPLVITLALCLLPGCRRGLDAPADRDEADRAMRTALEAWKSGKSQSDLEKGEPAILVNDDDWRTGKRLLDFKMVEGSLSGRQIVWRVRIKLQDKAGKTTERSAVYVIDTTPRIVIVRDTFAS